MSKIHQDIIQSNPERFKREGDSLFYSAYEVTPDASISITSDCCEDCGHLASESIPFATCVACSNWLCYDHSPRFVKNSKKILNHLICPNCLRNPEELAALDPSNIQVREAVAAFKNLIKRKSSPFLEYFTPELAAEIDSELKKGNNSRQRIFELKRALSSKELVDAISSGGINPVQIGECKSFIELMPNLLAERERIREAHFRRDVIVRDEPLPILSSPGLKSNKRPLDQTHQESNPNPFKEFFRPPPAAGGSAAFFKLANINMI